MNFKKGKTALIIVIGLFIAVILYTRRPENLAAISTVRGIIDYANSFGPVMPAAAFVITVIQALIPFLPFVLLCSANGLLFGTIPGIIFTLASSLMGASIAFILTRYFGLHWFTRDREGFITEQRERLHGFRGFWIILALRLQPYFPSVAINALAGVSRVNFVWFVLASALGKLPFIAGYTILGHSILDNSQWALGGIILMMLMLVPYLLGRRRQIALLFKADSRK